MNTFDTWMGKPLGWAIGLILFLPRLKSENDNEISVHQRVSYTYLKILTIWDLNFASHIDPNSLLRRRSNHRQDEAEEKKRKKVAEHIKREQKHVNKKLRQRNRYETKTEGVDINNLQTLMERLDVVGNDSFTTHVYDEPNTI